MFNRIYFPYLYSPNNQTLKSFYSLNNLKVKRTLGAQRKKSQGKLEDICTQIKMKTQLPKSMGAMKAILRGKFLTVNITKEERSQNQHS